MDPTLGRFFEGRLHETRMLLKTVLDIGTGLGPDVETEVHGRELVFRRSDRGRGFLRVVPREVGALLGFPRGSELFDPAGRAKGPAGLQKSVMVWDESDLDIYLRRMIREAYDLDRG